MKTLIKTSSIKLIKKGDLKCFVCLYQNFSLFDLVCICYMLNSLPTISHLLLLGVRGLYYSYTFDWYLEQQIEWSSLANTNPYTTWI